MVHTCSPGYSSLDVWDTRMTGTQQFRVNQGKIAYVKRKKTSSESQVWWLAAPLSKVQDAGEDFWLFYVSQKQMYAGETQITQWDLTLADPSHDEDSLRRWTHC